MLAAAAASGLALLCVLGQFIKSKDIRTGGFVFAILFAWAVKVALIEPFAIACLLQAFHKITEGQTPNPEWAAKLETASDKFRTLGERALASVPGRRTPAEPDKTAD